MLGCGSPPAKNVAVVKPATDAKEDPTARAERWRAREAAPMPEQEVSWLNGLASGRIQAEEPVKVECSEKSGVQLCSFEAFQGNDSDGDRMSIACQARTEIHRAGHVLRESLGEAGLTETPQLSSRLIGEGIEIGFVAETSRPGDDGSVVGTLKLSAFYTQNFSVFCWDRGVGARRTFERVVTSFLTSLKFKPHPVRPAYFAQGRVVRKGDRVSGLTYTYIQKREDGEPGSDESSIYFQLETDGKTWSNKDEFRYLFRDAAGRTERVGVSQSSDGEVHVDLLAKLTEGGKLRLKATIGNKSDSLEVTPKEPLSSELWLAPALLRLSKGDATSVKYSTLDLNEDGEPALAYRALTRKTPGVLLEEYTSARKGAAEAARLRGQDELVVDDQGFVKKQVSTAIVMELLYKFGQLPAEAVTRAAPAAPGRGPTAVKAKK
jgi:hypothetical protein